MTDSTRDRIGDAQDDLEAGALEESFSDEFRRSLERREGEVRIDEPGAPDREDYADRDNPYATYLQDCHDWALSEFRASLQAFQEAARAVDAEDYPDLGLDRPEDRERRDSLDDQIVEATEALLSVQEYRKVLDHIEDSYRKR